MAALAYPKLTLDFYRRSDVVTIARDLLGKILWTKNERDEITAGIIVETEAYNGVFDKACHAYNKRFTKRTSVMYENGGIAYVYLCYGMHQMMNVITNVEGIPDAVLLRAVEPLLGEEFMLERCGKTSLERLGSGPGVLTKAFGINQTHNAVDLTHDRLWLSVSELVITEDLIVASPRIGVKYAEEDSILPWRFTLKNNRWVSKAKS